MSNQTSEKYAEELEALRSVIPYATKLGAVQTNISLELLTVLLTAYDKAKDS